MSTRTVSCVMVTWSRTRLALVKRSVESYCKQTYDEKELLVVVCQSDDYHRDIATYVNGLCRDDVRIVFQPTSIPLGALRNIAVDHCDGNIVCQWDDDDIYHPQRISEQVTTMVSTSAEATFLSHYLHLFSDSRQVAWCNWSRLQIAEEPGLPGSLLARKHALPRYAGIERDEDSMLQRDLQRRGIPLTVLEGSTPLYAYTFHGENLCSRRDHVRTAVGTALEGVKVRAGAATLFSSFCSLGLAPPLSIVDNRGQTVLKWSRRSDSQIDTR